MDEHVVSTKDIYLAAAYLAIGAVLDDVKKDDPRHLRFVFLCDNVELDVEDSYINGKLMVSASKYAESIRHLKSIIHASD